MCVTADNSFLVTGGKDSLVHVWNIAEYVMFHLFLSLLSLKVAFTCSHTHTHPFARNSVLDVRNSARRSIEPSLSLQNHSLPITSVYASSGSHTKVVTASLDGMCVVWDLSTGMELCSLKYFSAITSAILSPSEHTLYAGSINGKIYEVSLYPFAPDHSMAENDKYVKEVQKASGIYNAELSVSRGMGNVKTFSIEDAQSTSNKANHACNIFVGHTYVACHVVRANYG